MINPYINNYQYSNTSKLVEDLIIQTIQMTGINVVLFDKKISSVYDNFLNEDNIYDYDKSIKIEAYIKDVSEFNGLGNSLTFFGLELKDKITISLSKQRYNCEYIDLGNAPKSNYLYRPLEGGLLYIPLNKSIYEIVNVNEDPEFLKTGRNFIWELGCELFNPNSEDINFNEVLNEDDIDTSLVNNFEDFTHHELDSEISNQSDISQLLENVEVDNPLKQKY
jgi:hypothetical protein